MFLCLPSHTFTDGVSGRINKPTVLQAESCRIGLRTVRITPEGMLTVNNRPVVIRGVNLHEHDPIFGHTITPQLMEADILIMKRHNFNAVRTSHYPQQPWFYELCTGILFIFVSLCIRDPIFCNFTILF